LSYRVYQTMAPHIARFPSYIQSSSLSIAIFQTILTGPALALRLGN
jgi:hypothetical protein